MDPPDTFRKNKGEPDTSRKNSKCIRWVLTLNNYTDQEIKKLHDLPDFIKYVAYSLEIAPKTGTPHVQGWVAAWNPCTLRMLTKQWLKRAHFEPMHGSIEQNDAYCSKSSELIHIGTKPAQGKRTDIIGVKRRLDNGESLRSLYDDESTFSLMIRNERAMKSYAELARYSIMCKEGRQVPDVYIRIGPTRTGKSSYVYNTHGYSDVFLCPDNTGKWFDGYRGESVILFDDVEAGKVPPVELFKRLCDGYPGFQAPVKGGFTYLRPKCIYFTSNHPVKEWWGDIAKFDWDACKERIKQVVAVYKDKPDKQLFPVVEEPDISDE